VFSADLSSQPCKIIKGRFRFGIENIGNSDVLLNLSIREAACKKGDSLLV
jgi:hypothetical protein